MEQITIDDILNSHRYIISWRDQRGMTHHTEFICDGTKEGILGVWAEFRSKYSPAFNFNFKEA